MKKLLGHCFCYPNKLRVCTWIASLLLLGSFIHLYHVNTQWSVEMQRRATLGFPNGGTAPLIALMMSPTF
ncbi:MAG: hypothetical protein KDK99_08500, partial [Verrucomicrobiales bacterium]|nr:hypothetical protein [Verrucomicrobiales bacterium]